MQKFKTKDVPIFLTPLNIFHEILEVEKTKAKKKQIHHQKTTFRNKYYLGMIEVQKEVQAFNNKNLTFRTKSNEEKC